MLSPWLQEAHVTSTAKPQETPPTASSLNVYPDITAHTQTQQTAVWKVEGATFKDDDD